MKNFTKTILLICFSLVSANLTGGNDWTVKNEHQKCFIENKGQFTTNSTTEKVKYAYDNGHTRIYFTNNGVSFNFVKVWKKEDLTKSESENPYSDMKSKNTTPEEWYKQEKEERKLYHDFDIVNFEWLNSNSNVQIIPEGKLDSYYNYEFKDSTGNNTTENYIYGYKKITYKNLYPNIDVEYTFHPVSGIKYAIILHPNADPSVIKMKYNNKNKISFDYGDLRIKTKFGDMIDHAPITFYSNDSLPIFSQFVEINNVVSFYLDTYDNTKTVIIDPWVVTPVYNLAWDCVWECDKDAAGNVYTIGGTMPLVLKKYNAAGTQQWTTNTPYDTTAWLGALAVDNAGVSYVSNGTYQSMSKYTTAGGLVYTNNSPGGGGGILTEFWAITFNCDQTKLVVAGTGSSGLAPTPYVYDINPATGSVTATLQVGSNGSLFGPLETRAIAPCGNGKYFWLSHNEIGWFTQNFSFCPGGSSTYKASSSYSLGYKCENWRYNNSGICAIKANTNFVYTHRGSVLHKRDLMTAAIIASTVIPAGTYGGGQVRNSGIDIDVAGNVYVGSIGQVVKYDANLVQLAVYATAPATVNVYDVHVSTGGNIIACGTTGTSGTATRQGYIQSWSAGAAAPLTLTCCDATICGPRSMCVTAAPVQLTASTAGGGWSASPVPAALSAGGVFNPAVAGVGIHTITYTLGCGTGTMTIAVTSACTPFSVCRETDNTVTASSGTPAYTWQIRTSTAITTSAQCTTCNLGNVWTGTSCQDASGTVVANCITWTTFATGANSGAFPAGFPAQPVRVVDAGGNIVQITDAAALSALPACSVVLPIELLLFDGKCDGNTITFEWTTATELNNDYFIIEESSDGIFFTEVCRVNGNGNSSIVNHYSCTEISNVYSEKYYRLKQVDYNGKIFYSYSIVIQCDDNNNKYIIYPNPTNDNLNIGVDYKHNDKVQLIVENSIFQKVYDKTITITKDNTAIILEIKNFDSGLYFLRIVDSEGEKIFKFIKN